MADAKPTDKGNKLGVNPLIICGYSDGISKGVALCHFGLGKIIVLGIFIVSVTR